MQAKMGLKLLVMFIGIHDWIQNIIPYAYCYYLGTNVEEAKARLAVSRSRFTSEADLNEAASKVGRHKYDQDTQSVIIGKQCKDIV